MQMIGCCGKLAIAGRIKPSLGGDMIDLATAHFI
jgi:hypothetical protein